MTLRPGILVGVAGLLAGGLLISVAVAWAASLWSPLPKAVAVTPTRELRERAGWPADEVNALRFARSTGIGLTEIEAVRLHATLGAGTPLPRGGTLLYDAGWPTRCVSAVVPFDAPPQDAFRAPQRLRPRSIRFFIARGTRASPYRVLPSRPIWAGLLANSVFYAAVMLGLLLLPRHVIRRRRRRAHRCPQCGYPRGASPRCAECGVALDPDRRPAAGL